MEYSPYSISRKGRLIDASPMARGECSNMWDTKNKEWTTFDGTMGEHMDSIPIDPEEAGVFQQTGKMPDRVVNAIATDTGHYPDPYDD